MKTILLEELDPRTCAWLYEASHHEQLLVTDRGTPIMTVSVTSQPVATRPGGSLQGRVLLPEFEAAMHGLGRGGTDSGLAISEDRSGAIP